MATGELVRRDICFKDLGVVVEENVDSIKKKVAQRLTVSHFFDPVKHQQHNIKDVIDAKWTKPVKNDSLNIIDHLNSLRGPYKYKYKQLERLKQESSISNIEQVIVELLEKGEQNGKLVATDQYILSEFIGKYVVSLINDEKILQRDALKLLAQSKHLQLPKKKRTGQLLQSQEEIDRMNNIIQLRRLTAMWQLLQIKEHHCAQVLKKTIKQVYKQRTEMGGLMHALVKIQNKQKQKTSGQSDSSMQDVVKIIKNFKALLLKELIR